MILFADVDWEKVILALGTAVASVMGSWAVFRSRRWTADKRSTESNSQIGFQNRDKAFDEMTKTVEEVREQMSENRAEATTQIRALRVEISQLRRDVSECHGEKAQQAVQIGILQTQNRAFRRILKSKGLLSDHDDEDLGRGETRSGEHQKPNGGGS